MSRDLKKLYRDRLVEGDVVYFIEGEDTHGNGTLSVKKASVDQVAGRRYPVLLLWDNLNSGPRGGSVTKSPREIFTAGELFSHIEHEDPSLIAASSDVDELLADPICERDIIPIIGGAVIFRMAEDGLAHPNDPER